MKRLLLVLVVMSCAGPVLAQDGFGRGVTGGDAFPTCIVSNPAGTGTGSFSSCARKGNVKVIFSGPGPYLVDGQNTYIQSNTTIDGCANGQNGVTLDQPSDIHRAIVFEAGSGGSSSGPGNIKVQCIRFQGHGKSAGNTDEHDLLGFDATNGSIVGVLVDRCTFFGATDGAIDLTGNVSSVTVSRSLFYTNPMTMLIKYGGSNDGNSGTPGHDISIHHNVFTKNGERNPQIRGGVSADLVSNVVGPGARLTDFEGGGQFSMYGTRLYNSTAAGEGPAGNVKVNLTNSAFLGSFDSGPNECLLTGTTGINICNDSGASAAGIYLSANSCSAGACAASPSATPNPIPAAAQVLVTPVSGLKASLATVGSPTRLGSDQAMLDAVAALLPGPGPSPTPTPTPGPTPNPTPTPGPTPSPTPTPCPVCPAVSVGTPSCTVSKTDPDAHTTVSTTVCKTTVTH